MFDDLRIAWRLAVSNFWSELREGDPDGTAGDRLSRMQRQVAGARSELRRLESELARVSNHLGAELREEQDCVRREQLAREVGDRETAAIAARYALRHRERAAVMRQKRAALEAERQLLARDVEEMDQTLASVRATLGSGADHPGPGERPAGAAPSGATFADPSLTRDFDRLRREERERAADARLEEMKRRMGG